MGLDQLCAEIDSRSQAQAAALLRAAHDDAKRTTEEAQAASLRTLEAARREAGEFASAEGNARLTACQLEAARHLVEAREEAVRQSLAQVWDYYRLMPKRAGYAAKLRGWAQSALDELNQPGAVLRANESDSEALRAAGFKVSKTPLDCVGGVRAETPDGRISVDLTLEAQFERRREDLLQKIHAKLFAGSDLAVELPKGGAGDGARPASRGRKGARARRLSLRLRSRTVRALSSSSMAMPVSSRAASKWRRHSR